jgi:hypothetical protein
LGLLLLSYSVFAPTRFLRKAMRACRQAVQQLCIQVLERLHPHTPRAGARTPTQEIVIAATVYAWPNYFYRPHKIYYFDLLVSHFVR